VNTTKRQDAVQTIPQRIIPATEPVTELEKQSTGLSTGAAAKLSRRDKIKGIQAMHFDGMTQRQIAKVLGISQARVSQLAREVGLEIGRRGGTRHVSARVKARIRAVIDQVASNAGRSSASISCRALEIFFADEATALRHLGKEARPLRAYRGAVR
jgi:predicted transcriptional regulator